MNPMRPLKIVLTEEELYCSECGTRLRSKGYVTRSAFVLDENLNLTKTTVTYQRAACPNPRCIQHNKSVAPHELTAIFLNNSSYTVETTRRIVVLHDEKHKIYTRISEITGIPTSTVHNIYTYGEVFKFAKADLESSNDNSSKLRVIEKPEAVIAIRVPLHGTDREQREVRQIGRTVVIDTTAEKMSRFKLFLAFDPQAEKVLMSARLKNATAQTYAAILETLISTYPVENVVSDMEASLKKALYEVVRPAHHQYCHFHFLKNAGIKLLEEDYERLQRLVQELSREVTVIIQRLIDACKYVNDEGCKILSKIMHVIQARPRSTVTEKTRWGDRTMPMFLIDLERGKILVATIEKIFDSVQGNAGVLGELRNALMRHAHKVNNLREIINVVSLKYNDFMKVRRMMADGDPDVRNLVRSYVASKKHLGVLLMYLDKYDETLWHYVNNPEIPRTITELERFFSRVKRKIRGVNPTPGVTLDRLGLLLPFIMESRQNTERNWSDILRENPQIAEKYKELWKLWRAQKRKRSKQIMYDKVLSDEKNRVKVLQELAVEMEAVALKYR